MGSSRIEQPLPILQKATSWTGPCLACLRALQQIGLPSVFAALGSPAACRRPSAPYASQQAFGLQLSGTFSCEGPHSGLCMAVVIGGLHSSGTPITHSTLSTVFSTAAAFALQSAGNTGVRSETLVVMDDRAGSDPQFVGVVQQYDLNSNDDSSRQSFTIWPSTSALLDGGWQTW